MEEKISFTVGNGFFQGTGGWKNNASATVAASATPAAIRNRLLKSVTGGAALSGVGVRHRRANGVGGNDAKAQNHHVEQPLRAGSRVLGKILIDENINCGEEKGVTDAVQRKNQNNKPGLCSCGKSANTVKRMT